MKRIFTFLILTLPLVFLIGCGNPDTARIADCNLKETVVDQGMCINAIAMEKDTEKAALGVCDQIDSGVKHSCYRNAAVKFENKPLCFENENEIETYICLANLAEKLKDPSICPEITRKKDEEFCYRKVAVATLDESHCDQITENPSYRVTCIGSVEYVREVTAEMEAEAAAETVDGSS